MHCLVALLTAFAGFVIVHHSIDKDQIKTSVQFLDFFEVSRVKCTQGRKYFCLISWWKKICSEYKVNADVLQNSGCISRQVLVKSASTPLCCYTQEPVAVVGRVCCDGNGRLNANSLLLEGSIETSSGRQVPLDVSNLPQFSLFPGQVSHVVVQFVLLFWLAFGCFRSFAHCYNRVIVIIAFIFMLVCLAV